MTPEQRELMDTINNAYDLLINIHAQQGLGLNQPLLLVTYDDQADVSIVVNLQYLPGRVTPQELLEGEDFTFLHLTEKPNLTLVPKD